jgi:hypothetical protein
MKMYQKEHSEVYGDTFFVLCSLYNMSKFAELRRRIRRCEYVKNCVILEFCYIC